MTPNLIFDIGMHDGRDTAYYLARGHRVVAVEADPKLVEDARAQFASEIASGRLTIVNCAVGHIDGQSTFWLCPANRTLNSFSRDSAARNGDSVEPVTLPVRTFTSLAREHGVPEFLKIDIEGFDHVVLRDIDPGHRPRHVSWEISSIEEVFLVRSKGYNAFKCVSQNTLTPIALSPRRGRIAYPGDFSRRSRLRAAAGAIPGALPLARALIRHSRGVTEEGHTKTRVVRTVPLSPPRGSWDFELGASGPTGDEVGGEWLPAETVIYQYLDYWLNVGRTLRPGEHGDWFDMHATTLSDGQIPHIGGLHG